MSYYQ